MALFLETRDTFPSFKESALRSSAPAQPIEPQVTISTSSLLYPDTALRTAWRLRRRSSTPMTPYGRPARSITPPARTAPVPAPVPAPALASVPTSMPLPLPIPTPAVIPYATPEQTTPPPVEPHPVFQYSTPPTDPTPVHNYFDKFRVGQYPEPRQQYTRMLSPPVSPSMSPGEAIKVCISCKSSQSPCWRPSWSPSAGQLCNSCGLRYKKTGARCISSHCGKIPSKGEWSTMNKNAISDSNGHITYSCLQCNNPVELRS